VQLHFKEEAEEKVKTEEKTRKRRIVMRMRRRGKRCESKYSYKHGDFLSVTKTSILTI
jgi:hypothetical protein